MDERIWADANGHKKACPGSVTKEASAGRLADPKSTSPPAAHARTRSGERFHAGHALTGRHPAAIHVDHLTGDVPGPVRSQEQDRFGDLLRLAEPLQRVHRDRLLDVLGRDPPTRSPTPPRSGRGRAR